MRHTSGTRHTDAADRTVKDIRRMARKRYSSEDKTVKWVHCCRSRGDLIFESTSAEQLSS